MTKNELIKMKEMKLIAIRGLLLILLSLYFIVVFGQPADVISFNAVKNDASIALQWQLAPANKLTTVIIERKNGNDEFKPVAEFWVNFDGNTERNFRFTDKKVKSKTIQYRLKLIGQSGDIKYTDALSLGKGVTNSSISNPAKTDNTDPDSSTGRKAVLAAMKQQTATDTTGFKVVLQLKLKEKERESNFL